MHLSPHDFHMLRTALARYANDLADRTEYDPTLKHVEGLVANLHERVIEAQFAAYPTKPDVYNS